MLLNWLSESFSTSNYILFLSAYLLGSVNFAICICVLMGHPSPRTEGSFNPGATNVLRIAGKVPAILTLLGDIAKGIVPLIIAHVLHFSPFALALTGFFAIFGHMFSIFLGFKGGKGVATSIGVLFLIDYRLGLAFLAMFFLSLAIWRFVSLSAMLGMIFACVASYFILPFQALICLALISLLVIIKHHKNIARLLQGQESKLGAKKKSPAS